MDKFEIMLDLQSSALKYENDIDFFRKYDTI